MGKKSILDERILFLGRKKKTSFPKKGKKEKNTKGKRWEGNIFFCSRSVSEVAKMDIARRPINLERLIYRSRFLDSLSPSPLPSSLSVVNPAPKVASHGRRAK